MRGLLKLALLAGAGWYAYRKLVANRSEPRAVEGDPFARDGSAGASDVGARVKQAASQAAEAARQAASTAASKARATMAGTRGEATDLPADAEPPEVRAAAMAAMPAVQAPATIPEPELRAR